MKSTKRKHVRRCGEGCTYFKKYGKDKWGYCILKKEQRSRFAHGCEEFKKNQNK